MEKRDPAVLRAILLLSFGTFTSMCTQRVCDAMLPELGRSFDSPLDVAAHTISYFAMAYGALQLFYGPLGDRWGKYRIVILACLACSVGCVLSALSNDLDLLVAARIFTAIGAAGIIPLTLAWVGDVIPYAQRQAMLARVGLGTMLGLSFGQLLGGWMSDTIGWRWAFVQLSLQFGVVAFLLWRHSAKVAQLAPSPATSAESGQWLAVAANPWARALLSIAFIEGALVFGVMALTASHLHLQLGLTLSTAGTLAAGYGLGGMLYMASARHAIARFGERGLAAHGGKLMAVCWLVVAYTPWVVLAAPACVLAGFGFAMFHNTMQVKATQMVPEARATGVTLFAGFLFGGQSLGVWGLAWGVKVFPSPHLFAAAAVAVAILGLVFARAIGRHDGLPDPAIIRK